MLYVFNTPIIEYFAVDGIMVCETNVHKCGNRDICIYLKLHNLQQAYKNDGFIARMMNLFVFLHYRNRRYGNDHYDKTCKYEIF